MSKPDQSAEPITLAIDAMGGDSGPAPVVAGAAMALTELPPVKIQFYGDSVVLADLVKEHDALASAEIIHADGVVSMTDKPAQVVRRGRNTSMWSAIEAVKNGDAQAIVSGGNTGALMAMSLVQLRMIEGVDRPAITALWPTPRGRTVILDVGANVEANAEQLVQFAIMGEAFFRTMTGTDKPTVGLLNVGAEELKGHELIKTAARILKESDPEMAFSGFVEGDDISKGTVDVVVTDGFTGNIAIKTAEGAARLLGAWVKETLTSGPLAVIGAVIMSNGLRKLKARIDPSSANGGVFLGLNGTVVKSHGGAEAKGIASAITMAANLASRPYRSEISATVAKVAERAKATLANSPDGQEVGKQSGNIKAVV